MERTGTLTSSDLIAVIILSQVVLYKDEYASGYYTQI